MITIDQEARERVRHPLNLDNMADRYKTVSGHYTFTSPSLWVIEKHLFYLLKNSVQKDFDPKYKWRPDYLAYDEYGLVTFAPYLMFVNNVLCIEEFDLVTVIVPIRSAIVDVCRDKFSKKEVHEMIEVDW